jgi:non-ribosomal peptide synthetase component E (peptide arylation enzyme)
MNIAELVSVRAAEQPRGMALIDGGTGRCLDFGRFEEEAGAMAAALGRAGLVPGSRVLLMVPVTAELYVLLAGLLRAGCVAVFVDPAAGLGHLGAACRGVVPDAFIGVGRAHLLRLWSGPVRRIARHFVVGIGSKINRRSGLGRRLCFTSALGLYLCLGCSTRP